MKKENIGAEDLCLAPQTELLNEASDIAQKTVADEKFPFMLHYDRNQGDFLTAMLQTVGATVEGEEGEDHSLAVRMNMKQLKLIKSLDCVERVSTDEGINPFREEEVSQSMRLVEETAEPAVDKPETAQIMTLSLDEGENVADEGIALASVEPELASAADMASARNVTLDSWVTGCICCPGEEQWFKFTTSGSGVYTIYTTGALDTAGVLYDSLGTFITEVDDYEPCGKLNFRIVCKLTANTVYYVKVSGAKSNTGSYTLRVTQKLLVDSVTITPAVLAFNTDNIGNVYELPLLPNTFPYADQKDIEKKDQITRLTNLTAMLDPEDAYEQRVFWYCPDKNVITTKIWWTNAGERYQTLTVVGEGVTKLYAYDWLENGKRGECMVIVRDAAVVNTPVKVDCENGITVYSTASKDTILGTFTHGKTVYLIDEMPQNETMFYVYGTGSNGELIYGWCSGEYLKKELTFLKYIPDFETTNVRSCYSTSSTDNIVGKLSCGVQVELIQENYINNDGYTWHKILYNNDIAYVAHFEGDYDIVTRWVPLRCNWSATSDNRYLTSDEMKGNAKIIYNYLIYKGWSKNAICGAIANMQAESSLSPGRWEMTDSDNDGDVAFGLLQWDPPTKWTDYAQSHGYEVNNIYRQLDYLIYSTHYGNGEWSLDNVPKAYQLYIYEYIYSTRNADDLAIVFLLCYERAENTSLSVQNHRGELARNWKEYFDSIDW